VTQQEVTQNKPDDKDLKLEAYRQKVAELTEQMMDLRVQLTRLVEALQERDAEKTPEDPSE